MASQNQTTAKGLVEKLIKVDSFLIKNGKGSIAKSTARIQEFNRLKMWFEFNHPTEEQAARYIKTHWQQIESLIPGGKQHDTYLQQFNQIIHHA